MADINTSATLKTNLVSYWDLAGDLLDAHGSNNLTGNGSPSYESDALHGDVLKLLAASNQYAWISDAAQSGLDVTGDMTLNIWFNPVTLTAPTSNNHALIHKWYHASKNQYQLTVAPLGNTLTLGTDDACSGYTYNFVSKALGITMAIDTWYMFSTVRTGTTIEHFLNAVSLGTGTCQTSANCTADFAIGIEKGRNVYQANARFCKAGVWNKAATSAEITELYNGGAGLKYDNPVTNIAGLMQMA